VGLMPYGITWLLMLLKVLHNPQRPIRIFIPKSKGKRDNIHNNVVNDGIKARRCSWVQCLMGLHGC
jgi:hypothetical protein